MEDKVRKMLQGVATGETLSADEAEFFMNLLMEGNISPIQTAGLLAAMSVRGESIGEIVGFAKAMKAHSVQIEVPFDTVDTCGTGGDGGHTFNISTASALVAAGAGVKVAKHGNRAISSRSGSADVLQALGANIDLDEHQAVQCLKQTGICFLFAPYYHPAMKYAAQTRKELGFRTIFNILGPLTNPLGPKRQVMGVYHQNLLRKVAQSLSLLGSHHALVVYGAGGIDEFSVSGDTLVAEVKNGHVREFTITPEEVGLKRYPVGEITGGTSEENAVLIRQVFAGKSGAARDVVLLNAGAVLYVSGRVPSIQDGVVLAARTVDSGRALTALNQFVAYTASHNEVELAQ